MPDTMPRMVDHDAKPGALTRCQICGSSHLREIIDLGHQPPCDSLLTSLAEPETTYPLRLMQCEQCSLAQLDYVVPADKVYPPSYPYKAGISWPVVQAHKEMALALVARFGMGLAVDVGCNDGTLLRQFKTLGCRTVGIEPTDIADIAAANGVTTYKSSFEELTALCIAQDHGLAKLITFTNVFAHMADLGEVMRGVCALLDDEGVLVVENHYLLDVLERNQFDTIYHEHIRTYSLKSLVTLFRQYGLDVFDVERVPRYGGNIRVYVCRAGVHPLTKRVWELLALEEASGLNSAARWRVFRGQVLRARDHFVAYVHQHRGDIVACSAPGRAASLLNFYGINRSDIPWTGELKDSLKLGKYLPGCHIEVVPNERIRTEEPGHVVLLAWHYGNEIMKRLRGEGVTAQFALPLPDFHTVTN